MHTFHVISQPGNAVNLWLRVCERFYTLLITAGQLTEKCSVLRWLLYIYDNRNACQYFVKFRHRYNSMRVCATSNCDFYMLQREYISQIIKGIITNGIIHQHKKDVFLRLHITYTRISKFNFTMGDMLAYIVQAIRYILQKKHAFKSFRKKIGFYWYGFF